ALDDVVVLGLTTNLPLLRAVASHPDFERGSVDTGWLRRTWHAEGATGAGASARATRRARPVRRPKRSRPPTPTPGASTARARGSAAGARAPARRPPPSPSCARPTGGCPTRRLRAAR